MLVLFPSLVVLALAVGGLGIWVGRLRAQRAEMQRALTAARSSETVRLAVVEEENAALRRKNHHLQTRFNEMQGEYAALAYSISHDLRAPLRSVDGFSQALVEDHGRNLNGTALDYLGRVRAAAKQLNVLIEALLGLSRLTRAPFRPETLDLSALAREVLLELAAREPARRVEWFVQPGLFAQGDRAQLGMLLRTLLGNAWKFSVVRTVAHLSFRAQAAADIPRYEVRDDGIGFDPQYAGKLFGVFQRLHGSDEFPGLGTGLAAAQRIVRRHGGTIRATGEPDNGALITFTLSAEVGAEPAASPAPPRPAWVPAPADAPTPPPQKPSVV